MLKVECELVLRAKTCALPPSVPMSNPWWVPPMPTISLSLPSLNSIAKALAGELHDKLGSGGVPTSSKTCVRPCFMRWYPENGRLLLALPLASESKMACFRSSLSFENAPPKWAKPPSPWESARKNGTSLSQVNCTHVGVSRFWLSSAVLRIIRCFNTAMPSRGLRLATPPSGKINLSRVFSKTPKPFL